MDHDALSKIIFALPQVMADLLRVVVRAWVCHLDLATLERLPAEHGSPGLRRVGDMTWRVGFRWGRLKDGTRPYIVLPTEFQSTPDRRMAERQWEYVRLHLDGLRRDGTAAREGRLPPVLPVVVYNGAGRWLREADPLAELPQEVARALARHQPPDYALLDAGTGSGDDWPSGNRVSAWALLQRSDSAEELLAGLRSGLSGFPGAADAAYREALYAWALALWPTLVVDGPALPPLHEFEKDQGGAEMTTLLEARMSKWRARLREQAVSEGREQGLEQGLEQGRADALERLRQEAALNLDPAMAERVSKLIDGLD